MSFLGRFYVDEDRAVFYPHMGIEMKRVLQDSILRGVNLASRYDLLELGMVAPRSIIIRVEDWAEIGENANIEMDHLARGGNPDSKMPRRFRYRWCLKRFGTWNNITIINGITLFLKHHKESTL